MTFQYIYDPRSFRVGRVVCDSDENKGILVLSYDSCAPFKIEKRGQNWAASEQAPRVTGTSDGLSFTSSRT